MRAVDVLQGHVHEEAGLVWVVGGDQLGGAVGEQDLPDGTFKLTSITNSALNM